MKAIMDLENSQSPPKDIFILSGQSNMVGLGGVDQNHHFDGVIPPECRPDPRICRLNARLDWELATDPLHYDIDNTGETCGVGPGMAFANAIKCLFTTVGLVPCAVGGTAIKEWARGAPLYERMVKRAKFAAANGGKIRALLWYQGESDTGSQHDAESYKGNMERLIENVRSDLGLPTLPIIQVAIASGNPQYIEIVRSAQKSINQPNVQCVDAKGLQLKFDNVHLTTESQVKLGLMLADAYLKHFAPPQPPSSPPRVN